MLEFKDTFLLWPFMADSGNVDPKALANRTRSLNADYNGFDWEIEDLFPPEFVSVFLESHPFAVQKTIERAGKVHREFTHDGKAEFHRFVKQNAILSDLTGVVSLLRTLRFYFGLSLST